jgi:hypothetical protein
MRLAARYLAIAVLLVTAFLGLMNGLREWSDSGTALQRSVHGAVILYGVLGAVAAAGLLGRRRWSVAASIGWAAATTYAASVASFAWSDPRAEGVIAGVIAAFVSTAIIGLLVVWVARSSTRQEAAAPIAERP